MINLSKREIIICLAIIIILGSIITNAYNYNPLKKVIISEEISSNNWEEIDKNISEDKNIENTDDTKEEKLDGNKLQEPKDIVVDICGAVKNEGIVILKEGDRVIDAINKVGGLTENADRKRINLAKILTDEEKIIIPEVGENIESELISSVNSIDTKDNTMTNYSDGKININTASNSELMTLNGIGEVLASRIIEYRKNNGPFKTIDEIQNVKGIGTIKFEDIKEHIKID